MAEGDNNTTTPNPRPCSEPAQLVPERIYIVGELPRIKNNVPDDYTNSYRNYPQTMKSAFLIQM